MSMLKQEFKEDETSLQDALDLSIKVGQNLKRNARVAPIIFRFSPEKNELTLIKIVPADQVDELIKKCEKVAAELESAKKEKAQAQNVVIYVLKLKIKSLNSSASVLTYREYQNVDRV